MKGILNHADLEERLVLFSVMVIAESGKIKMKAFSVHLGKQLVRSATSAALNYAEARSAESRRDFIHKMKITLKELRETHVCLKIIGRAQLHRDTQSLVNAIRECDELISIFVKSLHTARNNSSSADTS
ncbi:MAG: four helix bundle protein [Balneolaceae bacterium]|nr:MAG: four helix bundle protein [Balneolaceae bacterium]